jgi:hypothetical protein
MTFFIIKFLLYKISTAKLYTFILFIISILSNYAKIDLLFRQYYFIEMKSINLNICEVTLNPNAISLYGRLKK